MLPGGNVIKAYGIVRLDVVSASPAHILFQIQCFGMTGGLEIAISAATHRPDEEIEAGALRISPSGRMIVEATSSCLSLTRRVGMDGSLSRPASPLYGLFIAGEMGRLMDP
jgi:hypothetical protein